MTAGEAHITGEQLAQISRECGRLKAESYGKGPTQTKAYVNDNFVFVVMRGGITAVERTLLDGGDIAKVRDLRLTYQHHMTDAYKGVVEGVTGCQIATYESQVLFDPDYTVEIFVLQDGEDDATEPDG